MDRALELRVVQWGRRGAVFQTPKEKKFASESGTGIDWLDFTFGTHAAEVAVDEEAGEVSVLKYACCHDVGQALHPQSVEGQMHGGVAQGLGFTLMEQLALKNGIIQTPSLREYLIPMSNRTGGSFKVNHLFVWRGCYKPY